MTMRMLGVRGEITGRCLEVGEQNFLMEVEGESFNADVRVGQIDAKIIVVGNRIFVNGRIDLRNFHTGTVVVFADRIEPLPPIETK